MSKDDKHKGKVAGPQGGEASEPPADDPTGQGEAEDAATVMLEVPPGGFPGAESAFDDEEGATTLVDTAAAMAAANAVEGEGGAPGPGEDDDTPPVMWVNPNKKREPGGGEAEDGEEPVQDIMEASDLGVVLLGTGNHEAVLVEDDDDPERTVVYDNPLAEAERRLAGQELDGLDELDEEDEEDEEDAGAPTQALNVADIMAAMSGEHAEVPTGDEPVAEEPVEAEDEDEDAGAATMSLNVEEILAASGQYQAAQDEAVEEEEEEDEEEGAATQALSIDQIMAAQARATSSQDLEAVGEEQATVMLEVGAGADEGSEATVMLDVGAEDDTEATRMLEVGDDEDEDVDDAFETVMLDVGASADSAEHLETVMLDTHEAQVSAEHDAVAEASGAIKMGAAAKDKNLFEEGPEDIVDQADEDADFTADPRMAEVGDRVADRYRLTKLLGQGGFAVVFLGEDEAISGNVAVKVLQAEKSLDPDFAQRFKDEVKVVRHLQHPNTIKITDTGETAKGCLFMVMEFVEGEELDNVIKKQGAMDPARTVHIGKQILRSLAEAHEKGVIHRDLKPQNVMLTQMSGEEDYVKVLDFGIAKALEADLTQAQTKTGVVFCTPRYAPPEILTGRKVSAAADVYALGLMMSEMLAGTPVIAAPSDAEAIAYQLSPEPPPIPPEVIDTPLGKVLRKATDKDVDQRYENAGEMLDAINKIGQEHLPTVPLLITSANPTLTGQLKFDSTLQMGAAGREATVKVSQAAAAERRTPVAAIAAGVLAIAAAIALIIVVTSQQGGPGETADAGVVATVDAGAIADAGQQAAEERPRGPSARDVLEARLAASDWQAGSWLEEEPPRTRSDRTRVRVVTRNEATGEEREREFEFDIPLVDVAAPGTGQGVMGGTGDGIAMVDGGTGVGTGERPIRPAGLPPEVLAMIQAQLRAESEGTGGSIQLVDAVAVQVDEEAVDETVQKLESERVAALYQSAQSLSDALNMLDIALDQGAIPEEEREQAISDRIFLTQSMVEVLVGLDRCDAAERRVDASVADIGEVPTERLADVDLMRTDVEDCRDRVARERQWDPRAYRARLEAGNRAYGRAQDLPEDDLEGRQALLYQSLTARREAIDMLETALNEDRVPEQHREAAGRDLAQLNQLVMVTMYDLNLNEAAQGQATELEASSELLPEDARAEVTEITAAVEEDERQREEALMAPIDEPTPEGTGALAIGPEGTGTEAAATGTGEVAEVTATPAGSAWNSERFSALIAQSADLLEEADEVEEQLRQEQDRREAEEAAVVRLQVETCQTDADCEEGDVCLGVDRPGVAAGTMVCQPAPEPVGPPVYTVRVRIDSQPRRVRVLRGADVLGRTPFDVEIQSEAEEIVLTLRKTDYETERLVIPMTEVTLFEAEVEMELRNVFGRTQTLSERLRQRRGDR